MAARSRWSRIDLTPAPSVGGRSSARNIQGLDTAAHEQPRQVAGRRRIVRETEDRPPNGTPGLDMTSIATARRAPATGDSRTSASRCSHDGKQTTVGGDHDRHGRIEARSRSSPCHAVPEIRRRRLASPDGPAHDDESHGERDLNHCPFRLPHDPSERDSQCHPSAPRHGRPSRVHDAAHARIRKAVQRRRPDACRQVPLPRSGPVTSSPAAPVPILPRPPRTVAGPPCTSSIRPYGSALHRSGHWIRVRLFKT